MRILWKYEEGEFRSEWERHAVAVRRYKDAWCVFVDGHLTRRSYATAKAAMESVTDCLDRIIMERIGKVEARQRPYVGIKEVVCEA